MDAPRYKAFISYSHRDEVWARWLQHALEKYRVPKHLVGTPGAFGPIPARLNPVFRDREDLSSASDLTTQIKSELARSESLVVICSPTAAVSPWVGDEIRYFRQLGQSNRILALIVDGDPQATDPAEACFPAAILEAENGDSKEPLAADVRKYADGKRLALLKIVAGILGIRLDELRRRDAQRRTRNWIAWSLIGVLLTSVMIWLVYSEATTRASAQAQRTNTEELLGFMLGDLKRLSPIEGLEVLPPDDETQSAFRQELGLDQYDQDELLAKALQWRAAGLELHRQGDLKPAMDRFLQSRAAIIERHQRDGNTYQNLFELGQAEFYVGLVHWHMGELDQTQESWTRYGAVTRRLVNAEPNNASYVMELSYTLMNLGALEQSRPSPDASKSLQLIQASIQYNRMALVLEPENDAFREELVTAVAWLADAWLEKCELGNAFDSRKQSVSLRRERAIENLHDQEQVRQLAFMLTGLAGVQQQMGLNDAATASFKEAEQLLAELHQAEPNNADLEWELIYRRERLARHLMATGDLDAAWQITQSGLQRMEWLSDPERNIDQLTAVEAALFRLDHARMLLALGHTERGEGLLRQVNQDLTQLVHDKPGFRHSLAALSRAYFEYWKQFEHAENNEIDILLEGYLAEPEKVESCSDASDAARLAVIDGNLELAKSYTDYVLSKGYFEADFVSFCMEFQLCDLP
jgi:tetratricopeptide (TPR) repeat protein